ncbi:MAG TPA: hypothetical protein VGF99_13485 [Myxococcota bacterium]
MIAGVARRFGSDFEEEAALDFVAERASSVCAGRPRQIVTATATFS